MQMPAGITRWLPVAALAATGTVAGHTLSYVLAFRNTASRNHVLSSTGHSYWWLAGVASLSLALYAVTAVLGRHARRPETEPFGRRLLAVLAAMQAGLFLAVEIGERLAAGVPIGGVLTHALLPTGLGIQVLVALVSALVLRIVARAGSSLGRRRTGRLHRHRPELSSAPVVELPRPALRLAAGGRGLRGPPRAPLTA